MNHQASYVMNLSLKRHKDTRFNVTNRCQITLMHSSARRSAPQAECRGHDAADESSECSSHAFQTRPHALYEVIELVEVLIDEAKDSKNDPLTKIIGVISQAIEE